MISSPLLRQDVGDLAPATQLALIESVIADIEAKPASERSAVEKSELPNLKDYIAHLEVNLGRARDQNSFVVKGGTVPCPKCGHRVPLEVNAK